MKSCLKYTLFLALCLSANMLFGQASNKYAGPNALFFQGEDLFEQQQYSAARTTFRNYVNQQSDPNDPYYIKALYYEGISAIELFNNDAVGLLERFNQNYPESIYKEDIFFRLGGYYFQKKNYHRCIDQLSQVQVFSLNERSKQAYYYKLGTSYYELGEMIRARNAFYEIKDDSSSYAAPALYYYSHIAYDQQAYQEALEGFEKLVKKDEFQQIAKRYIVQIFYRLKRYQDVCKFGPEYIEGMDESSQIEMNHLIGDAYYELGKYDESVPYLRRYNQKVRTTRGEDYQLAYALYKSSLYEDAISLFDRIARKKDTIGQISLYHIGESYLKLKNNASARAAFEAASVISINPEIQEDALYNYAILSYRLDINPYDEAIEALELYLKRYPNSNRKKEVYEYLLNVYTSTNNYALALRSLDKIQDKDIRLKSAYQMIAFNQGADYFRKANFNAAINAFSKVSKYDIDPKLSASARYWVSDAYYQLKNYALCVAGYKSFLENPGSATLSMRRDAMYNMAYAYLKLDKPQEAIEHFRLYLQQSGEKEKDQHADVLVRLADAYYTTKQNDLAIRYYSEHLRMNHKHQDHSLYYLAKTFGYQNDTDSKIRFLLDLINNHTKSPYIAQAIYDVGLSYRFKNEDVRAKQYFNQLVADYPKSRLLSEAQIELADILFKEKNYSESEKLYKKILEQSGTKRNNCARIVKGIVEIYKVQGQPERIESLIKDYPCAEFTPDDQEELFYNTAVEPYLDSNYQKAIPQLEKYLGRFSDGKYVSEIRFYLGNCHYVQGHDSLALIQYRQVLEKETNDFTELSAIRASKYLFNKGDYEAALPYYKVLEQITSSPDVTYNSLVGIMRSSYFLKNWSDAYTYSQKLRENPGTTQSVRVESRFVEGISLYHLKEGEKALDALEWTSKNATNVFAAESKYMSALIDFEIENFDRSEKKVKELIQMKPSYDYWIAKALMLESKIQLANKDLFQAEYSLKSVIEHYPNKEDGILLEANQLLDELMQLKNKPKEVTVPETPIIEIKEND
ncbi:MAG: tetratricopeptide repeat protein [Bacteroidetes bacterium]|nr:MAG: tetratricopeptide repeat protein [Bacteroidota bacterium]